MYRFLLPILLFSLSVGHCGTPPSHENQTSQVMDSKEKKDPRRLYKMSVNSSGQVAALKTTYKQMKDEINRKKITANILLDEEIMGRSNAIYVYAEPAVAESLAQKHNLKLTARSKGSLDVLKAFKKYARKLEVSRSELVENTKEDASEGWGSYPKAYDKLIAKFVDLINLDPKVKAHFKELVGVHDQEFSEFVTNKLIVDSMLEGGLKNIEELETEIKETKTELPRYEPPGGREIFRDLHRGYYSRGR